MTRKETGYADFPVWVANMCGRYRRNAKERSVQFQLTISQFLRSPNVTATIAIVYR